MAYVILFLSIGIGIALGAGNTEISLLRQRLANAQAQVASLAHELDNITNILGQISRKR